MAAARRSSRAGDVTLGGITVALIILSLYGASVIRNNTVFFIVLSNYISAIPYIRGRIRTGVEAYAAVIVLAIFVVSDKIYIIIYAVTGIYPLIKLLCESKSMAVEFILKYLYYNVSMVTLLLIYDFLLNTKFISLIWPVSLKTVGVIAAAEIFFLIYDLIFSRVINYIKNKLMGGIV